MKKTFCKTRRGHWVPLAWAASFLLWGNVAFHAASFGILESSLQ